MLRFFVAVFIIFVLFLLHCLSRSSVDSVHFKYHKWFNDFSSEEILAASVVYPQGGSTFISKLTKHGIMKRMDRYEAILNMDSMATQNFRVLPFHIFSLNRNLDGYFGLSFTHYRDESTSAPYIREPLLLTVLSLFLLTFGVRVGNKVHDYAHPSDFQVKRPKSRQTLLLISFAVLTLTATHLAWYISFDRTTGYRWSYNNPYLYWRYLIAYSAIFFGAVFFLCAKFRSQPRQSHLLNCRQCGYSSHGSTTQTCPECGVAWNSPRSALAKRIMRSVALLTTIVPLCIVAWGVWTIFPIPIAFGQPQTVSLQFHKLHAWLLMAPAAPTVTEQTFIYWLLFS